MDAELREYLEQMEARIIKRTDAQIERVMNRLTQVPHEPIGRNETVERRQQALEDRMAAMHVEFTEKLMSVDDRFRSLKFEISQVESRLAHELMDYRARVDLLRAAIR